MPTTIKLKNSVTTTNAPSSLAQGEVAINITDKKVWVGNAATTPIQLLGDGGSVTFTSLTVTGVSTFSAGTVSAPSITTSGDTNTGIFFPAADTIAFTEGGVESMRIDSSGNVGIGVIPSAWSLAGSNAFQVKQASLFGYLNNSYSQSNAYFNSGWKYINNDFAQQYIQEGGSHQWLSAPSGTAGNAITFTERMRITSSGNVGIGTSSPSARLTSYNASNDYQLALGSANTFEWKIGRNNADGKLYFQGLNGASTVNNVIVADLLGNVGIGTSSPAYRLDVSGGHSAVRSAFAQFWFNSNNTNNVGIYNSGASGGGLGQMVFETNSSERMRITSGGDVLVGTTNTWFNRKVIAEGTEGLAGIVGDITTYPLSCMSTPASGNNLFAGFWTDSRAVPEQRGTIDYNRAGGLVRYNTTSDGTLKNIIGDSDRQKSIEILNTTRIREFAWKDDESQKPQIGVIAQELYETYKGAVSVGGEDAEGNYRPWGVDKTAFTFHLIAGWQEHQKIIQEQQQIINDLKARIETLESK